jgi:hypothetical protein
MALNKLPSVWTVKFRYPDIAQDQHAIAVHYGVEPVRDQDRGVAKILANHLLNGRVSGIVDRRRRLVQDQHLGFPEQRSRNAQELPLSLRKVFAALGHLFEQSVRERPNDLGHLHLFQVPHRIETVPNRVGEDDRILRNYGNVVPAYRSRTC